MPLKLHPVSLMGAAVGMLTLGFGLGSPRVLAQESPGNDAAAQSQATLEEVTVTARKRAESLQTTPLSVSAFGAQAMEERNIQSAAEVTSYVPNVQFDGAASESGGGASTQIAIRGIGQNDYVITVEPAVGIYLDGVYVGKSIGSLLDTVDVDRIEVLRGPQGTLFGKNTIGGAVQLISKRPSASPEFYGEATTGSFDRMDLKAGFSAPLSDALRVRTSVGYMSRDGYVKRLDLSGRDTGERQGNQNRLSGRVVAEIDLSPDLMATVSLDGTRIREESPATVVISADETAAFPSLFNAGVPGGVCLPSAGPSRFTNKLCYNSQYALGVKSYSTFNSGQNYSEGDIWGSSLTLSWNLGSANLKSISAYRSAQVEVGQETTSSPYNLDNINQDIDLEQFSEELQLSGTTLSDRLNYVVGLYYLQETGTQVFPVDITLVQFVSGGKIKNDSYAAFGQLTYDITDKLSVTGGLRYTDEQRQFNPALQHVVSYNAGQAVRIPGFVNAFDGAFGPPGTPIFPGGWYKRSSTSLTPMASVNYKFNRDVMAYATFSKGFKGGGFTMRYFPPVVPAPGTDPDDIISYAGPEKATSYEVGIKSELFDRRLRLNLAAFDTDYSGIQVTYNVDPDGAGPIGAFVPVLANAGTAKIRGVELEATLLAADWLRFDGSVGYLDGKYVSFSAEVLAAYPDLITYDLPNTPEWTGNVGSTVTFFDNDRGRASLRADYSYRASQFKEFLNNPMTSQDSYSLINAVVFYTVPDNHWTFSLGGTNLTDEAYIISAVSNPGVGEAQGIVARPREWYVRAKYEF